MKDIKTIEKEIIEQFTSTDDWMVRYEQLIELGRSLPPLPDELKTDENAVKGCQSQVWLSTEQKDGRLIIAADSDALITKGIVALLIQVLSGQAPSDIVEADLSFIKEIGLEEHLSPARRNGLSAMINKIKNEAQKYVTQD